MCRPYDGCVCVCPEMTIDFVCTLPLLAQKGGNLRASRMGAQLRPQQSTGPVRPFLPSRPPCVIVLLHMHFCKWDHISYIIVEGNVWTLHLCMFEGRNHKLARHKTRVKPPRCLQPEKRSLANKRTHVRPRSILRGVFEPRLQLIARPIPCNRGRRPTCVRHASASLEQ